MDILYLAHRLPYPPNKGCKLRAFRQLQRLSRDHRVWCATFLDTPEDEQFVKPLARVCHRLHVVRWNRVLAMGRGLAGLAMGRTLTESFYKSGELSRILQCWNAEVRFDAVAVFSSAMARYAQEVDAGRRVIDLCDLDSGKWTEYSKSTIPGLSHLYALEGHRLAGRERDWLHSFDATILITNDEAAPLMPFDDRRSIHVVENGVEVPAAADEQSQNARPTVGFMGVMDYKPNVDAVRWFAGNCWDQVRQAVPDAEFHILGRRPVRAVRRLARMPGITVVGEVADATKATRALDVSVAPLRIARGLQNKVLEAMACGKPVVLTPGAARGIDALAGRDYLVANEPGAFARHVVSLLSERSMRQRVGCAGRAFVARRFCWSDALDRYEQLITGIFRFRHADVHASADGSNKGSAKAPRAGATV